MGMRPDAAHHSRGAPVLRQVKPPYELVRSVLFRRSLRCSGYASAQSQASFANAKYNCDVASRASVRTTHNESSAAGAPKWGINHD